LYCDMDSSGTRARWEASKAVSYGCRVSVIAHRSYRMPTGSERLIWGFGDETDVKVCKTTLPRTSNTDGITLSSTICWENYMPLLRYRMYELGTQIYCAPTVDNREVWQNTMTHIALEGRCFVLSACQISTVSDANGSGTDIKLVFSSTSLRSR
jgi:predicted amidohydrolase